MKSNDLPPRAIRGILGCAAALFTTMLAPSDASAYCADLTRASHWGVGIPVYVTTSGPRDVSQTQVSDDVVINAVISVLEMYNQSAADIPFMYFAGELSSDTADKGNQVAGGIIVMGEGPSCDMCSNGDTACHHNTIGTTKHTISLRTPKMYQNPVVCSGANPYFVDNLWLTDLMGILLHEFGHALGLGHTNGNCGAVQQGGDFGIMNRPGLWGAAGRRLRRDDIFGLMHIYDERMLPFGERVSTNGGFSWSGAQEVLPGLFTRTPVRGSSASWVTPNPIRAVAFSQNVFGFVGILSGNYVGWDDTDPGIDKVDIGAYVDPAAVAVGRNPNGSDKIMVAYYANESSSELDGNIRWGIKTHTGTWGGWSLYDGDFQESKIVGAGFEDQYRRFVISTVDDYHQPVLHTVNPDTGAIVATTLFSSLEPYTARDTVGDVACYMHGVTRRCVMPVTTSSNSGSGPCMGWYELSPNANGTFSILGFEEDCSALSHGPGLNFAADPQSAGSHGFLTNRDTAALNFLPWNQAYTVPRDAGGGIQPTPTLTSNEISTWPVGVGSMARIGTSKFILYTNDLSSGQH